MTLHGESSGTFEIKSPADKFFRDIAEHFSRFSDTKYEETIQHYSSMVDWEKKTLTMEMDRSSSGRYKTVTTTITVTPKEDGTEGGRVVWTFEFEKIRHDFEDPHFIIDHIVSFLKTVDG